MTTLRIRVYNVLFGDAMLLTVPDEDEEGKAIDLHVLVDIGNALAGAAGNDAVFEPIFDDLRQILGEEPLDLYVMTHEHMDHVQGAMYGAAKLAVDLKAKEVWMTASSAPDYYERFEKAKLQKLAALAVYEDVARFCARSAGTSPAIGALLALNNPRASRDCVDHIRKMGPAEPLYVHRQADIAGRSPFRRAKIRLLAPEEDTSVYYGRLGPHTLGLSDPADEPAEGSAVRPQHAPPGVAQRDFEDLVRFRSSGMFGNLLQIDKAANNSSVVMELDWEGWVILLPGDAEEKSWEIMERRGVLRPAHFLKVSHHGSRNGSPSQVFDTILPAIAPDGRRRVAVVSTQVGAYAGVPDGDTLTRLATRAELHDTRDLPPGGHFDIVFEKQA